MEKKSFLLVCTVWAADFETPVGSSTFFSFFYFSWAALAKINNK
jgi:hypothetical protein